MVVVVSIMEGILEHHQLLATAGMDSADTTTIMAIILVILVVHLAFSILALIVGITMEVVVGSLLISGSNRSFPTLCSS